MRTLIAIGVLGSASSADAAACLSCPDLSGTVITAESARQQVTAAHATLVAAGITTAVALATAGGNVSWLIKGERASNAWFKVSLASAIATIMLGGASMGVGANLRSIARDVYPFSEGPSIDTQGSLALTLGGATLGAGVSALAIDILARFLPLPADTSVTVAMSPSASGGTLAVAFRN